MFCSKKNAQSCASDPIRIDGLTNLLFLGGVIAAVIVGGALAKLSVFYNAAQHRFRGILLIAAHGHTLILPYLNLLRDSFILIITLLSFKLTSKILHTDNSFSWGHIKEVAVLFAGIFITIIPALAILSAKRSSTWRNRTLAVFLGFGHSFKLPGQRAYLSDIPSIGRTDEGSDRNRNRHGYGKQTCADGHFLRFRVYGFQYLYWKCA